MTDIVVSGLHLGLDANTITTYWLSYDRDNMVIKYGKGYAMEETTLLICDFSEGVTTAENWQGKGSSGRCFLESMIQAEQRLKFFCIGLHLTLCSTKKRL